MYVSVIEQSIDAYSGGLTRLVTEKRRSTRLLALEVKLRTQVVAVGIFSNSQWPDINRLLGSGRLAHLPRQELGLDSRRL